MNLLIASQTGHGKSFTTQYKIEKNLDSVDILVVLDYDDEYRGLVKAFDSISWHPIGPIEQSRSKYQWAAVFERYPQLVCPRYRLDDEEWRDVIASVAEGIRVLIERSEKDLKVLIAIDEAHSVAPQGVKYPKPITNLAVDGRGELISTIWVSQRRAMLDKNITSQCTAFYYGSFTDENDLNALSVDYPVDVHNPTVEYVKNLPEELRTQDGESIPVRQFRKGGELVGSEWIYSDTNGNRKRESTRNVEMKSVHYGRQGYQLEL